MEKPLVALLKLESKKVALHSELDQKYYDILEITGLRKPDPLFNIFDNVS